MTPQASSHTSAIASEEAAHLEMQAERDGEIENVQEMPNALFFCFLPVLATLVYFACGHVTHTFLFEGLCARKPKCRLLMILRGNNGRNLQESPEERCFVVPDRGLEQKNNHPQEGAKAPLQQTRLDRAVRVGDGFQAEGRSVPPFGPC